MTEMFIAKWDGAPHTLIFAPAEDGRLGGVFKIEKPKATQAIEFALPEGVTLNQVRLAWEAAGKKWTQIWVHEGSPFVALRTFAITPAVVLVWNVFHYDDRPYDGCSIHDSMDVPALVAALSPK